VHYDRMLTESGFGATHFGTLPVGWVTLDGRICCMLGRLPPARLSGVAASALMAHGGGRGDHMLCIAESAGMRAHGPLRIELRQPLHIEMLAMCFLFVPVAI
jgi:hypothetical protein